MDVVILVLYTNSLFYGSAAVPSAARLHKGWIFQVIWLLLCKSDDWPPDLHKLRGRMQMRLWSNPDLYNFYLFFLQKKFISLCSRKSFYLYSIKRTIVSNFVLLLRKFFLRKIFLQVTYLDVCMVGVLESINITFFYRLNSFVNIYNSVY